MTCGGERWTWVGIVRTLVAKRCRLAAMVMVNREIDDRRDLDGV